MKALIIQTMLALLIPGLTDTPKQALTPPATFDSSIKLNDGSPVEWGPVWSRYYTSTSVEGVGYDRLLFENYNTTFYRSDISLLTPIWSVEPTKNKIDIDLILQGITPITQYSGNFYEQNYAVMNISSVVGAFVMTIDNPSPYPIRIYFDISSNGGGRLLNYRQTKLNINMFGYVAIYHDALTSLIVEPFSAYQLTSAVNNFTKLDALYFDILPSPNYLLEYSSEIFSGGFDYGYNQAVDEFGNFDWLSSLFTTMGDLLAIEILPGISIGLILLIPIVFGVLRFIMGLFR